MSKLGNTPVKGGVVVVINDVGGKTGRIPTDEEDVDAVLTLVYLEKALFMASWSKPWWTGSSTGWSEEALLLEFRIVFRKIA